MELKLLNTPAWASLPTREDWKRVNTAQARLTLKQVVEMFDQAHNRTRTASLDMEYGEYCRVLEQLRQEASK